MPLLKCTAGKARPKNAITYITKPEKAAYVSVRNLFEDEDYAKQFEETAAMYGKGTDYKERKYYHFKLSCAKKITSVHCKRISTPKNLRKNCSGTMSA